MVPLLDESFSLKPASSLKLLLDLRKGDVYKLTDFQYRLLTLCDGRHTDEAIISKVGIDKAYDSQCFINQASDLGIVRLLTQFSDPIGMPSVVPDPHLRHIHWEITKECNLRCDHCLQEPYLTCRDYDIDYARASQLVSEMHHLNVLRVSISGGEPFVREDLFDILQLLEAQQINIRRLFTNGLSLTPDSISKLGRLRSCLEVVISLDGFTEQTMWIRHVDLRGIRRITETVTGLVDEGLQVAVNTTVSKYNVKELTNIYKGLLDMGISRWRLGVPMPIGSYLRTCEFLEPRIEILHKSYLSLLDLYFAEILNHRKGLSSKPMEVQIDGIFLLDAIEECRYGLDNPVSLMCDYDDKLHAICLKPNGSLTPCSEQIENVLGNVMHSSLREVWYSNECQNSKRIPLSEIEECIGCNMVHLCGGGCRANYDTTGYGKLQKDQRSCANMKFLRDSIFPLMKSVDLICDTQQTPREKG